MAFINYNDPNQSGLPNDYNPYKGMSDEERTKAGCLQTVGMVGAIILALLICALFGSCTTTKYVPVIEHKTDTVRQCLTLRDSIWLHDSISVKEKGDTVRIERWHTKYVSKEVHDTTYISKTDSVPVPYEVAKEVPRKRDTVDLVLTITGMLSILGIIVWVVNKVKRFLLGM